MATFRARVEAYTGDIPTGSVTRLETFLTSGARFILNILKPEIIRQYSAPYAIGNGLSTALLRVTHVLRNGIGAISGDVNFKAFISDPLSIFYATERSPISLTEASIMTIHPPGGAAFAYALAIPTSVLATDTALDSHLPPHVDEGMILYAAERYMIYSVIANIDDITYTAPSLDISAQLALVATYLNTEEDIELGLAELQVAKTKIDEYQARVQNATAAAQITSEKSKIWLQNMQAIQMLWKEWLAVYAGMQEAPRATA